MAGGLIQLVARGIQDIYLTNDPQITFFKVIYRRHTNFAIESIIQNFNFAANFGETVTCELSRAGDMIGKIFLYVDIPALPKFYNQLFQEDDNKKIAWVNYLGYALIQEIIIEIGGKQIDKQYGEWMYIWSQVSKENQSAINKMVGNVPSLYEFSNGKQSYKLYIPLEFWFCKNSGLSLPLIALMSTNIKLIVSFRKLEECFRIGPTHSIEILEDIVPFKSGDYIEQSIDNNTIHGYVINYDYLQKKLYFIKIQNNEAEKKIFESYQNNNIFAQDLFSEINSENNKKYRIYDSIQKTYCTPKANCKEIIENITLPQKPNFVNSFLYVDYVYLDTDERSKFVKTNNEYLIEQIQYNQEIGIKSSNVKQNLVLNHPCKSHYWIVQLDKLVGAGTINDLFNYSTSHVRHSDNKYYGNNLVENAKLVINGEDRFSIRSFQYFNYLEPYQHHSRGPSLGINTYSPSINPENHQPSSTINMSKIDHICMQLKLKNIINAQNTARIRSYTVNYNILRVCFGLAGLVFV